MTLANGELAIAVCDRCNKKRAYRDLIPDGNIPGLRVCSPRVEEGCWDHFDPWRLPPPPPDPLTMRHPRPDTPLTDGRRYIITQDGEFVYVDEQGDLSP